MRRGDPVEVKLGIFVVLDCFAAARNDRFVIIDIYVLRYRYICVAPPLCIIFLSSLTKQKKKSWQFRTSLLI